MAIVLFVVFSFSLAYLSVSSVWTPHALSDDVFYQEEHAHGEFAGSFPWSELSYPLTLGVVHTPFKQLIFQYPNAYGEVRLDVFFADSSVVRINGTFWYFYPVMGPMPLQYKIDSLFSDPSQFFGFLIGLYALVNLIGALLGIIISKTLYKRVHLHH